MVDEYVEGTFQVVSNFGYVRHFVILDRLSILFRKFKLHFIGEEKFNEKVHDFGIFLIFEVVIEEHLHTSSNQNLSSIFILVDGSNGAVTRIGQRP